MKPTETMLIGPSPHPLIRNHIVASNVELSLNYEIGFDINLQGTLPGWGSIIHATATGGNYGQYGDRIPGVWVYPNTTKLHIVAGHGGEGDGTVGYQSFNDECPITEQLEMGGTTRVKIVMKSTQVRVFYNGISITDLGLIWTRAAHVVWHSFHATPSSHTYPRLVFACRLLFLIQ